MRHYPPRPRAPQGGARPMQRRPIIMKIALGFAALLAFGAPAVSAAPADKGSTERVSYTDPRGRDAPSTWIQLASPTPARHGREYIAVDARYAVLRIDATTGQPRVRSVRIRYTDGTERVVELDQ